MKGLCVRGELEIEQSCNILTPSSSGYNTTSFSFYNNWLQTLISNSLKLPVAPGYIIVWCPPASVSIASVLNSTHPQSRLSPDIFDQMHLLFTQVYFLLTAWLGRRSIFYKKSELKNKTSNTSNAFKVSTLYMEFIWISMKLK